VFVIGQKGLTVDFYYYLGEATLYYFYRLC